MKKQFPIESRQTVEVAFDREWQRRYPKTFDSDHQREERAIFLMTLESLAASLSSLPCKSDHKTRKRKLTKAASALAGMTNALAELDRDAVAYVLYLATCESDGRNLADAVTPMQYFAAGHSIADKLAPILSILQIATARAAKCLPGDTFRERVGVAQAIKHEFSQRGFNFTVSAAGFAAMCLVAVFEAAGMEAKSPQHWLEQARDNEVGIFLP